ncbi:MAG: zinc ABC transporter substrate-binding protein, partial [Bacteroidia bacterium]|nr:zinc ABC transporter substrate-binding protein [Bacteroidia bacterium]
MIKKFLIVILFPLALVAGCTTKQDNDTRPAVTVTILPLRYFAEQLAGNHFRINVLIPPGVSHHNYDPTPRQLQELEKSKVLFINGHLGFEKGWIPKLRSNYRKLSIIDLSAGIDLITEEGGEGGHVSDNESLIESGSHSHTGVDPHYWMSVSAARKLSATMAAGLIQADPACRQVVEKNLAQLAGRLDSLAASMSLKFKSLTHRSFIIFHPALAYLARDYNMLQHSMELAGKEPTASHFRELVDIAR